MFGFGTGFRVYLRCTFGSQGGGEICTWAREEMQRKRPSAMHGQEDQAVGG